jgi:REP element-mobilizing transposase RayT
MSDKPIKHKRRESWNIAGHSHYLTFSTLRRRKYLLDERICILLASRINQAAKKLDFAVLAYVFMPDHVHLLIHPMNEVYDMAKILQAIKQGPSRSAKNRGWIDTDFWGTRRRTRQQYLQCEGSPELHSVHPAEPRAKGNGRGFLGLSMVFGELVCPRDRGRHRVLLHYRTVERLIVIEWTCERVDFGRLFTAYSQLRRGRKQCHTSSFLSQNAKLAHEVARQLLVEDPKALAIAILKANVMQKETSTLLREI